MKTNLLFNQSFGTVSSPNQTGETQTRENRIGLMSYLRRTLMLLFAVLVMSIANIGMAWGADHLYFWFSKAGDATTNSVTNNENSFFGSTPSGSSSASGSVTIDGTTYTITQRSSNSTPSITFTIPANKTGKLYAIVQGSSSRSVQLKQGGTTIQSITWENSVASHDFNAVGAGTYTITSSGNVGWCMLAVKVSDAASTKRIYMKAGAWNTESPYFYAHSWGSSNNDVLMTLADCETDVFYADIPSGNTSVLFTRQSTNAGIKYKGEAGNWNQSDDITISTNDKFTFNSWDGGSDGKSTFTSGTYSAPTYTISFAANGGSGSMSSISSIACGDDQALPANTFTKSGYVFDGWKADVAVTIGGSSVAAGTKFAGGSTLQNITSNITLTAQWEENSCPSDGTLYSLTVKSATYSVPATTETNMVSDYATVSGGGAYIGNKNGSAGKAQVTTTGSGTVYFNGADGYLKLVLDCPIQTGDVLTFTNGSGSNQICFTTTNSRSTDYTTVSNSYTFPAAFNNVSTIYVWRTSGSSTYLHDLTITRSSSCTAPTALAAASTTAKGTTFTITDGANTNDYEFYVVTSSGTPASNVTPTHTTTNKTLTITDCIAGTTYYAWVRSKCSESNKSDWVALTGNTFTTLQVTVTHTLTNVTATSGATGANAAGGSDYTAVFAAVLGYSLPAPAITIDGNAAESGTDYTWTQGTGTVVIPANKITGDIVITIASAAAAPSSVAIGDNWLWFAGETMTLTATPTGGNGPVTYQWYKGGKADGNAISGATSATFTKTCAFEDAGSYYCKVTCGGTQSTWGQNGDAYDVKIPRLYVKTGRNDGQKTDYGNVDFTRATASTATASISLGANWDYCYNIADGCGHYYGNAGTMQYNNYGPWVTNVNNQDCGLHTTNGATYVFTINYSNWSQLTTTVTFPSSNQAADKVIYFDNSERQWTNVYYRIGHTTHVQASAMDKVYGTANLYTFTTTEYNNFMGWHITNATGETGSNTNIYNTVNSPAITYATAHEGGAVTQSAVTVTPTTSRGAGSDTGINDNCTFYNYDITNGMKTDNVAITAPSNGTITVAYTDVNNAAQSFTSGNRDLAHTVILTSVTATPATGYDLTSLTINGNAHTSGNSYTCSGATTIAASFTLKQTTITINANTANHGSTTPGSVTATYGSALPSFTAAAGVSGYSLTGYFTTATSGTKVINADGTLVASTDYADGSGNWKYETATLTLYAQYEEEGCTPTVASVTFDNNKSAKYNTQWVDGDVTTSGGASWAKNSLGADNHKNCYMAMKLDNTGDYIKITLPTGVTSGSISVQACTYSGNAGVIQITNSGGTELANAEVGQKDSEAYYKVNSPDGGSWTAPTLKTLTYNSVTSGGDYYIKKKSGANIYVYAFSATGTIPCCNATPDAPTSPTNGATTSTTQAVSWTDAGNDKWEVYVSTGNSTPAADQTPTAEPTSASYTFTGLTASTTYYWWVRSVCDASHKSSWVAGTSFTTSAAEPDPLIHWTVTVDASSWSLNGSPTTTDGTNITSISSSIDAAASPSTGASGTTAKVALATASDNVTNAASFTFTINSAKKVEPEKVTCQVFNVGSGSGNQLSYKAQLSDNSGHVYYSTNSVKPASEASLTDATFNFASDLVLTGNVTMKVYGYQDGGTKGTAFRMGADVKLFGEVQNAADYTVTHTLSNVTKSAGATSVKEGNNYTATYAGAGGYALPSTITVTIGGSSATAGTDYTWTQGTGVVSIPGNKVTGNIVITVTGVAVVNYSITYHCNGAESGCPSDVAATTNLPSPLPTGLTKDGYTFGGWYTDEELTVSAVAGAALTGNTDLYAKWTVNSSSECITIAYFDASQGSSSSNKPDKAGKYLYGYTNSAKTSEYAYTLTTGNTNNKGQGTGASDYLRMDYGTTVTVYADNTTTGGTPASFENVTGVSVDFKMKNSSYYTSFDIYVGDTKIADNVSLSGAAQTAFTTFAYEGLAQLSGTVRIVNKGSGSSNYHFYVDNIEICTASMSSCTTPTLPTLSNQSLCEGSDIAAWDATPTNASTITGKGESITYSWKKKGNDTELVNTATFDLGASAAESQAGTYVVTVTVSKAGYASATATKEVTLSVTDGIEVTGITADKATVYPTNSVTLTATASADATWQWYTCTNAEGAGAAIISGAESASYTIASAGAAGTYYYKAVATGSCGTGSMVYTLTVSAAAGGDCETEFWFAKAADKPESATAATHITGTPSGSSSATYTATIDGNSYPITGQTGQKTGNVTIVVPEGNEGTLYVVVQGSSSRTITLSKGGVQVGQYTPANSTWGTFTFADLDEGTYTLVSSGNIGWGIIALKLCSGEACTDPEVTASVNNSTACVGSSVTFTATGAHASANYQWQKYSGGAWTNIDATASTYTIASVVAGDAGKYRVIATHDCSRTSNEVTLNVPVAPVFGSFTATRSVMATQALSITDVEASDATSYAWYKSADATYDAGTDTKVGTTQELLLASGGEAAGATYYLFCVASNACGSTTSSAITVNVTAFIEEDCATRGTEGAAEFGFQNSGCGQGSYQSANCYTMNSNSKILVYSAPDGKYFKTMKVTIASSSASKASYNWSTNGGSSYTADGVAITGVTTTLTEKTIDLSAHGNVNEVKIGRNFGNGESSGTLYVSKICFEYTAACATTTVTPSTESTSYVMGGAWSNPTFTLGPDAVSSGTLTYSSSDEEIASVDESGNVTFNGTAGTVTITAAYAGATIAGVDYCASEGSYTITVSCEGGAPKIVAASSVNMSGCNSSVTLNAKKQDGTTDFTGGSYQWFRNGEEIEDATAKSYTATQTGVYTVAYTSAGGCTSPSTNNATVTSTTVEPEVTKLVPFHYYHVDKTYTAQMKDRHLFSVKGSAEYGSTGKNFKLTMSRNGEAETDMTTAASIWVKRSDDGQVDSVMIDLNKLSGKYSEGDELVLTCAAVDCSGNVSAVYKDEITINVIGATPTLALICSGSNEAGGTRNTKKLTVGGDFLTGYNVADLCQQTGNTSFDANTEWGLYTRLKENYIVTPVNGYAVFNKLNYEPFDILLLTDYPKASKSDAAATVLDDMADLCDYRPMLSFKAHMVAKSPSKWAAKGFTTSPVVPKNTRTRLNIVCYAHPMFSTLKSTATHIQKDNDDPSQIVYTMLTGAGYEGSKGLQGFELEAAENFVTIGLVHYNATPADGTPSAGLVTWTPGDEDRMLVTAVERQENLEARMIMFAVNCGAQSKFTETGRNVVLKCLEYLLDDDPLHVADCSFTFDNGAGNSMTAAQQAEACESCTGTKGDGKWSTAANWGPDYVVRPGKDTEVKIAAPVIVDPAVGAGAATNFTPKVRSVRILEGGKVEIPAGSYLEVVSTIRRQDGNDIYPTEVEDLHIGSSTTGNGTLIFNNSTEDTKAQVDMYSKGFIDHTDPEKEPNGVKNYQYIGTPFVEVNALYNYYGSWIYYWKADGSGWKAVKNGGPMTAWTGYCITQEEPTYHQMSGTLTATGTVDINVPADANMVVGNSWTAPIDLGTFTTTDFENMDANVYFFNTGIDKEGTGTVSENATGETRWAAGTYVTVPVLSAEYTGEDDHIPSLQGFFVKNTNSSAGTLHLDYDKHVRGSSRAGRLSEEMHAPARRAALSSDDPVVLKMKVSGENYDDKLLLLEREDFTEGFDNGWDGDKWDGNESALYIYTTDSEGTENSVSAVPELEGTVIGFRAGEDDAYTLNFEYLNSDEPLYLYDSENSTYTRIMTGVTYRFFTTDKSKHARFIITRKSPQITTAVGNVSDDGLRSSKVKKLLLDNKLFILRNGMLYDATGKVVK